MWKFKSAKKRKIRRNRDENWENRGRGVKLGRVQEKIIDEEKEAERIKD